MLPMFVVVPAFQPIPLTSDILPDIVKPEVGVSVGTPDTEGNAQVMSLQLAVASTVTV